VVWGKAVAPPATKAHDAGSVATCRRLVDRGTVSRTEVTFGADARKQARLRLLQRAKSICTSGSESVAERFARGARRRTSCGLPWL
jgi:hypothetical protein